MIARTAAAAAALVVAGALPAYAHHSIQAVVDTSREVSNDLVLTRIDWVNPHAWFHFSTKAGKGDIMVEWLGLAGMRQAGYRSPDFFTVGRTYKVTYNPNRDGTPGGQIVSLVDETTGQLLDRLGPEGAAGSAAAGG